MLAMSRKLIKHDNMLRPKQVTWKKTAPGIWRLPGARSGQTSVILDTSQRSIGQNTKCALMASRVLLEGVVGWVAAGGPCYSKELAKKFGGGVWTTDLSKHRLQDNREFPPVSIQPPISRLKRFDPLVLIAGSVVLTLILFRR